jgi:small subunit ribosomal protein S8|tara:strand:- start:216 stop:614 length:399 start_codon:yes stop_codon:yes gene_type:complete
MSMTDPVADYLTRIRNGQSKLKKFVDIPCSNIKKRISYILKEEHFVRDFIEIKDNKQNMLRVFLKYDFENEPVIHGIKRISKPGCRIYVASDKLPRVLNGLGISILTTSKGIISNKKAKQLSVGGEVLCHVW